MKKIKTSIGILAVVSTVAFAAIAFAHGPYGSGGYGGYMMGPGYGGSMMGYGYGGGHMMGYGYGYGPQARGQNAWGNLSEEQTAQLERARERFFNQTRKLRNAIDDKKLDMRNELTKQDPDQGKVTRLQNQISELQAQLDQKAVAHQLEVRKLLPENYDGLEYGRPGARGYGGGYCR